MNSSSKIISEKNKIQAKAVELSKTKDVLLLNWATGCGKSLAAIKIIEEHKNTIKKWNIVVFETAHINNWLQDFKDHGKEYLLKELDISIFCYASMKNKIEDCNKGWVFDEGHHLTETKRKYLYDNGKPLKIVTLSATMPIDKEYLYKVISINLNSTLHKYSISTKTAIDKGILPTPKIITVFTKLDKNTQKEYSKLTSKVNFLKNKYLDTREESLKFAWLNMASKRKSLLASYKNRAAKKVIAKVLENSRYIVFTHKKSDVKEIGGDYEIISSDNNKKINGEKINLFNNGDIDSLYAVKMLREGMNLKNIEKGLICQLDNSKLSFTQMLGRVFRSDYPTLYVLVVENTQDHVYYKNVSFNEKEFIEEKRIEDI